MFHVRGGIGQLGIGQDQGTPGGAGLPLRKRYPEVSLDEVFKRSSNLVSRGQDPLGRAGTEDTVELQPAYSAKPKGLKLGVVGDDLDLAQGRPKLTQIRPGMLQVNEAGVVAG